MVGAHRFGSKATDKVDVKQFDFVAWVMALSWKASNNTPQQKRISKPMAQSPGGLLKLVAGSAVQLCQLLRQTVEALDAHNYEPTIDDVRSLAIVVKGFKGFDVKHYVTRANAEIGAPIRGHSKRSAVAPKGGCRGLYLMLISDIELDYAQVTAAGDDPRWQGFARSAVTNKGALTSLSAPVKAFLSRGGVAKPEKACSAEGCNTPVRQEWGYCSKCHRERRSRGSPHGGGPAKTKPGSQECRTKGCRTTGCDKSKPCCKPCYVKMLGAWKDHRPNESGGESKVPLPRAIKGMVARGLDKTHPAELKKLRAMQKRRKAGKASGENEKFEGSLAEAEVHDVLGALRAGGGGQVAMQVLAGLRSTKAGSKLLRQAKALTPKAITKSGSAARGDC